MLLRRRRDAERQIALRREKLFMVRLRRKDEREKDRRKRHPNENHQPDHPRDHAPRIGIGIIFKVFGCNKATEHAKRDGKRKQRGKHNQHRRQIRLELVFVLLY